VTHIFRFLTCSSRRAYWYFY